MQEKWFTKKQLSHARLVWTGKYTIAFHLKSNRVVVAPVGIEPASEVPETSILSIELQSQQVASTGIEPVSKV
jgi:hypothetical protein